MTSIFYVLCTLNSSREISGLSGRQSYSWDHTLSVYIYSYMKNVYGFQCDLCDADYVGYSRGQETTFSVFA